MALIKLSRSFTRNCPDSWSNNSICNLECMNEVNGFDGGDCDWLCSLTGCNRTTSDGICDLECNTTVCAFDYGDCGYCRPGCPKADFLDNNCDQNCNFEECDYDNLKCGTCAKGCTTTLNYNSICNQECNRKECNWDNNRCSSPCNTYCHRSKVGDGKCDPTCNTTECSFDGGDCYCSPGCPPTKFGNGMCDTYCNTSSCFYDYGECFCAPGCSPALLLNKKCDPVCNVTKCYFDMNDCICPENCTNPSRPENGPCNPFCNISACAWDNGRCHCAPGCFPENISNGVCNEDCFNPSCFYDGRDCDCSLGCSPEMQLNNKCESACNNTACKFDNEKCFCSPGCNFSMINDKKCDAECNNNQCWYDGGDCNCKAGCFPDMIGNKKCEAVCNQPECNYDAPDCECYPGCTYAIYNELTCNQACNFKSCNFHKNLCGDCAPNCFTANLTNNHCDIDCKKSVDCDFDYKDCADIYYYWPNECKYAYETITNIYSTPCHRYFEFAKNSLNAQIFMIGGNFTFTNKTRPNLLSETNARILIIEPLYCSSISIEGCYLFGTRALFNLSLPMQILVTESVKLISIEFTSFHPTSSLFSYCPFIKTIGYINFDDRGEEVASFNSSLCDLCIDQDFIQVSGSSKLYLSNILFKDMRFEYNSILNIKKGEVVLQNVSFFNVVTRNVSSVIQTDPAYCASGLFEVKFNYSGGSIIFINNGFEVISENLLAGFLSLCNIEDLTLENLYFSMNVFSASNLMKIVDVYRLRLENITVEFSYSNSDLISFENTENSAFFNKSHTFLNDLHFWLSDLKIKTNVAKSVIVLFLDECRNVKVEDCDFESNEVESSVFHYKISKIDSKCITGGKLLDFKGIKNQVKPREFVFNNSRFFSCFSKKMVLLEKIGKITIQSLDFEKNLNFSLLVGSSIASKIQNSGGYMKKTRFNVTSTCTNLLSIDSAFSPVLKNSSFLENFCVLADVVNTSNSFLLNSSNFFSNEAIFDNHLIFLEVFSEEVENITNGTGFVFSYLEFENNSISEGSGGILKLSKLLKNKIKMINVSFESSDSAIYSEEVKNLEIESVSIKSGTSSNVSVLSYLPAEDSVLSLSFLTVESCRSLLISIKGNQLTKMTLTISESSFTSNQASNLIFIDNRIKFSEASSVTKTIFQKNSGLLFKTLNSGFFSFTNNNFFQNSNEICCIFEGKGSINLFWSLNNLTLNKGTSLISLISLDNSTSLESISNIFNENEGSAFAISFILLKDSNSSFFKNSHFSGPVLLSTSSSVAILKNLLITENIASSDGIIANSLDSSLFLFSLKFKGNSAGGKGGGLFNDQNSSFLISDSEFEENSAEEGSCIYSHYSYKQNLIKNSTFQFNSAGSSTVSLLESDLKIVSSRFYSNYGKTYAGVSSAYHSTLIIENSSFNNSEGKGASLHSESSKIVKVFNSNFTSSSTEGLSFFGIFSSRFECNSCRISKGDSQGASSVYCQESTCLFFSSNFEDLDNTFNGAVVQARNSQVFFNRCKMTGLVGSGVFLEKGSELFMNFSEIFNSSALNGAGVKCLDCEKVNLFFSNFSMMGSLEKGGCCFFSTNEDPPQGLIKNSSFFNCSAQTGGALFLSNSNFTIIWSIFSQNTAISGVLEKAGQGGSIFIESRFLIPLKINASSFYLNSANSSGGAIQWYDVRPALTRPSFKNNSAFYGPDIGSFPDHLSIPSSRKLQSFESAPGQKMLSSILIYSVDHYNQVVLTDDKSSVQLSVKDLKSFSLASSSKQTASSGLYNFSEVVIKGMPLSHVVLVVVSDFSDVGNEKNARIEFEVKLRECFAGETLEADENCLGCPPGKYNLIPRESCKKCPEGAICYGGNHIVSKKGFWRNGNNSDVFYECPFKDACLLEVLGKFEKKCLNGYTGKLCQACESGFFREKENQCAECMDKDTNIIILSILSTLAAVIVILLTSSNINSAYKEQSITSIYFKIFTNHSQIIALTISFNLDWPDLVLKLFKVQSQGSGGAERLFSLDCFISDFIHPYYAKLIMINLLPAACAVLSVLYWSLRSLCGNCELVKSKIIGSIIVQLFFFQPSIMKLNFSMFSCMKISDGKFYMSSDMSIQCWSDDHLFYSMVVALPGIVIWCLLIPFILALILVKSKSRLDQMPKKLKYGFLYKGYEKEEFYWEFVILLKKIGMISCAVFLRNFSVHVQALSVFLVILITFILQLKIKPYLYDQLNNMDSWSMVVSAVTIYSGLYFMTNELNETFKLLFFILMVFVNALFGIYWTYYTFGYYIGKCLVKINCCKNRLGKGKWIQRIVPDLNVTTDNKDIIADSSIVHDSSSNLSPCSPCSPSVIDNATADATMDKVYPPREKQKRLKLKWVRNNENE